MARRTADVEEFARGRHLCLLRRGGWEFVDRLASRSVVMIIAVTDDARLVLVEQFRPPVNCPVIGLVGDEPGRGGEPSSEAACRELEEETGYRAGELTEIGAGASSAGLTNEMIEIFLATSLRRVGAGGGVGSERITVHEVALTELDDWLAEQRQRGAAIDLKVFTAAHLARRHGGAIRS